MYKIEKWPDRWLFKWKMKEIPPTEFMLMPSVVEAAEESVYADVLSK